MMTRRSLLLSLAAVAVALVVPAVASGVPAPEPETKPEPSMDGAAIRIYPLYTNDHICPFQRTGEHCQCPGMLTSNIPADDTEAIARYKAKWQEWEQIRPAFRIRAV